MEIGLTLYLRKSTKTHCARTTAVFWGGTKLFCGKKKPEWNVSDFILCKADYSQCLVENVGNGPSSTEAHTVRETRIFSFSEAVRKLRVRLQGGIPRTMEDLSGDPICPNNVSGRSGNKFHLQARIEIDTRLAWLETTPPHLSKKGNKSQR